MVKKPSKAPPHRADPADAGGHPRDIAIATATPPTGDKEFYSLLEDYISRGIGRFPKSRWTGKELAAKTQLTQQLISNIRNGKLPNRHHLESIGRAFFPDDILNLANANEFSTWRRVTRMILGESDDFEDRQYNPREVWSLLLNPIRGNSAPLISKGGNSRLTPPYFKAEDIKFEIEKTRFVLPMPDWFLKLAPDNDYDVYEPGDFSGPKTLAHLFASIPSVPPLDPRELISRHTEAYAREVSAAFAERRKHGPYNKLKLGVSGYQQSVSPGKRERAGMKFWLYTTDYFTHRVMRRVLHEVRSHSPSLFEAKAAFFEEVGSFPSYFTTSFGLNLVVVTTHDKPIPKFHMVRLSPQLGNANQHGLLHISANEGLNTDDISFSGNTVDLERYTARTLSEELGTTDESFRTSKTIYLQSAIEILNFEPYLSGLVYLGITTAKLADELLHARDRRREITDIFTYDFTDEGIINLLIDSPRGTADFSSYALLILDRLLLLGLAPNYKRR